MKGAKGVLLIASILFIVLGFVFIYVGYLLRKNGRTSFIAGYKEFFFPKNEKKLASWIGGIVILFGVSTIAFPVLFSIFEGLQGYHFFILAGVYFIAVIGGIAYDQLSFE